MLNSWRLLGVAILLFIMLVFFALSAVFVYADHSSSLSDESSISYLRAVSQYGDDLHEVAVAFNAELERIEQEKQAKSAKKEAEAVKQAEIARASSVVDAGAPLSIPTTSQTNTSAPYTLNTDAAADVSSLGYSMSSLRAQGIQVLGHSGAIPRKCATGTSGGLYTQGMAVRPAVRYNPCPNGQSPLYDAYRPAGYDCVVIYNSRSSKSQAVLAHEIGHCLHFAYGLYGEFDLQFRELRGITTDSHTRAQSNEVVADDFMICRHGLDTNYGASSYYSRYSVARPTAAVCKEVNTLINTYLIK